MNNAFLNPDPDQPVRAQTVDGTVDCRYIVAKRAEIGKYANEHTGALYELATNTAFSADVEAHGQARNIRAMDAPIVVRVPPSFGQQQSPAAVKALEALHAMLFPGPMKSKTISDDEIADVVKTCGRVIHAFQTLRDRALRERVSEVLKNMKSTEILRLARTLNIVPEEFKNDPFYDPSIDSPPGKRA